MKLLTVAVPTYNVEKYLDRCLLSLLYDKSILNELEIIIVNDGSKDSSLLIARKYEKLFPNTVMVIDKENGGHGSTINVALKVAKGKYFRVIDSDDWVNIIDFPKHFKDLKKYSADIILTNYSKELVYKGTNQIVKYTNIKYNNIYDLQKFDLKQLGDYYFFLATSIYKTETLRGSDFLLDEKTFYVDMEIIVLSINNINTFAYLDYDIYRYFIGRNDQSVSIESMIKNRSDHEKVLYRLLDYCKNTTLSKNKREYIEKIITLMLETHYSIYCGSRKHSNKMRLEILSFNDNLKKNYFKLYSSLIVRCPHIKYCQKTRFLFTNIIIVIFRIYGNHFRKREK